MLNRIPQKWEKKKSRGKWAKGRHSGRERKLGGGPMEASEKREHSSKKKNENPLKYKKGARRRGRVQTSRCGKNLIEEGEGLSVEKTGVGRG